MGIGFGWPFCCLSKRGSILTRNPPCPQGSEHSVQGVISHSNFRSVAVPSPRTMPLSLRGTRLMHCSFGRGASLDDGNYSDYGSASDWRHFPCAQNSWSAVGLTPLPPPGHYRWLFLAEFESYQLAVPCQRNHWTIDPAADFV